MLISATPQAPPRSKLAPRHDVQPWSTIELKAPTSLLHHHLTCDTSPRAVGAADGASGALVIVDSCWDRAEARSRRRTSGVRERSPRSGRTGVRGYPPQTWPHRHRLPRPARWPVRIHRRMSIRPSCRPLHRRPPCLRRSRIATRRTARWEQTGSCHRGVSCMR